MMEEESLQTTLDFFVEQGFSVIIFDEDGFHPVTSNQESCSS